MNQLDEMKGLNTGDIDTYNNKYYAAKMIQCIADTEPPKMCVSKTLKSS